MPASAAALPVSPGDQAVLRRWANAAQARAVLVQRARVLLLAAEASPQRDRRAAWGLSPDGDRLAQTLCEEGLTGGLADQPRAGRSQTVRRDRRAQMLATSPTPPPEHLGVTQWSSRLLAAELDISNSTVARVWAEHDVKPWQTETI